MPFTVGELIKVFEKRSSYSMWPLLFLYVTLRFLQGSGGLAALRDVGHPLSLYLLVFTFTLGSMDARHAILRSRFGYNPHNPFDRLYNTLFVEMSELSFNHLLNLSFAFHTRRKTGEILRVLDRGAAINHTLEVGNILLFDIIACLTFIRL